MRATEGENLDVSINLEQITFLPPQHTSEYHHIYHNDYKIYNT